MKKNIKLALLAVIASVCLIFASVSVLAAAPTYNMSSDYKSGRYYDNFRAVDLVGDGARDTLAIALSQLGYHEGNDNSGRDGLSIDGDRDFVEYNVLYGKLDNNQGNGVSYGYYWCASFVNWCLRQAGVSKEASAAAEVSCRRWLSACQNSGIYHAKTDYIPKSADIIFFKQSGSSASSTHMGLVLYSDGERVYTIEGNTSNGSEFSSNGNYVALKSYKLSSSYIVGYATPKYNVSEDIGEIDYTGKTFSAGKYISTENLSVYKDKNLTEQVGRIDAFTVFEVEAVDGDLLLVGGHYLKAEKVKQITASCDIRSLSYLNERGKKIYPDIYAKVGETVTVIEEIPERSDAYFVGWSVNGREELVHPGDTISLNESTELYAVYDDTKTTAAPATEEPTEFISLERTEATTEKLAVETESESKSAATERSTDGETKAETDDDPDGKSDSETEDRQNESTDESISEKNTEHDHIDRGEETMLSKIFGIFGCRSSIGAQGIYALVISSASAMIFRKSRKKDEK